MQRSGIRGFGVAIIPDSALLHPGYAGSRPNKKAAGDYPPPFPDCCGTSARRAEIPEKQVARVQRSGIRGFGIAIIPDSALLHPGYAG